MIVPERLAIDSNCFVCLRDPTTPRGSFVDREVVQPLLAGARTAVASAITLAELLVRPFRDGNDDAAREVRASIEGLPGLELVAVDNDVAEDAARVGATYGLKLPDAIHVATAVLMGAEALLNDRVVERAARAIPILVLDDALTT